MENYSSVCLKASISDTLKLDEIRWTILRGETIKYTLFILQGINNSSANNTIAFAFARQTNEMATQQNSNCWDWLTVCGKDIKQKR